MVARQTNNHRVNDGKIATEHWPETYAALKSSRDGGLPGRNRSDLLAELKSNHKLRHSLFRMFVVADAIQAQVVTPDVRSQLLDLYYQWGKKHLHDRWAGATREENPLWYPALHGAWRDHVNIVRGRAYDHSAFVAACEAQEGHVHDWFDMRNEVVRSGEMCACGALRASTVEGDPKP